VIRRIKHKNKEYIIINTTYTVDGKTIPFVIQADITTIDPLDRFLLSQRISSIFHKKLSFGKKTKEIKNNFIHKIFKIFFKY
jgi:hypothetical protein